jgi:hypothetical protein
MKPKEKFIEKKVENIKILLNEAGASWQRNFSV